MNNDTFEYHLEKAIEAMLRSSNINIKSSPTMAEAFVKERIYTMVNYHIKEVLDNLLSK